MRRNQSRLRGVSIAAFACAAVLVGGSAQADFVTVGDAGNSGEWQQSQLDWFGDVNHVYDIGKYEVTAGEYVQFLSAAAVSDPHGLYNSAMNTNTHGCKITRSGAPGSYTYSATDASLPVNFVSWYDAARYSNWLTSGNSESGVYQFDSGGTFLGINLAAGAAAAINELVYMLPTEDEWYKAAYYDPTRTGTDKYWWHPTGSDAAPTRDYTETINPGNNANHIEGSPGGNYGLWDVGTCHLSDSYYGTFDQGGNVKEWFQEMGWRGGSWEDSAFQLNAQQRHSNKPPTDEYETLGFRVVARSAAVIPEPGTGILLLIAALVGLSWRKR